MGSTSRDVLDRNAPDAFSKSATVGARSWSGMPFSVQTRKTESRTDPFNIPSSAVRTHPPLVTRKKLVCVPSSISPLSLTKIYSSQPAALFSRSLIHWLSLAAAFFLPCPWTSTLICSPSLRLGRIPTWQYMFARAAAPSPSPSTLVFFSSSASPGSHVCSKVMRNSSQGNILSLYRRLNSATAFLIQDRVSARTLSTFVTAS
mmetsp:Transcript_20625/g.45061  ORF Transcript_20625/g.45061 Transcript_20625/m.45061 type:complete len:203 (+) Transcript_20625:201-809(+)